MPGYTEPFYKLDAAFDMIKDARLHLRGSDEYDKADKKIKEIKKALDKLKEKDKASVQAGRGYYQPTGRELEDLKAKLEDGLDLIDTYLDTKKDIDELDMSTNTTQRVEAIKAAKQVIEKVMPGLNADIEEHNLTLSAEAPSADEIVNDGKAIRREILEAKSGVFAGSQAYEDAANAYEKLTAKWNRFVGTDVPDPGAVEEMKAEIEQAQKLNGKYRLKKDDKKKISLTTDKRLAAMERASEHMDAQMKLVKYWEEENTRREKDKTLTNAEMSVKSGIALATVRLVDRDSTVSSTEFRKAKKAATELDKEWKRIHAAGPHSISADEIDRLEKLNNELEKNVDKYVRNKAGKDLNTYERARLDAMLGMKRFSAEMKGVIDQRKAGLSKDADTYSRERLGDEGRKTAKDLKTVEKRVNGQRVWRGSRKYKKAAKAYIESAKKWDKFAKDKSDDLKATDEELADMKADLEKTKATIQKYMKRHKDMNVDPEKESNDKIKARMEAMQRAYDNVDKKLTKINQAIAKRDQEKEKDNQKAFTEHNTARMEALKNSRSVDKYVAKAAAAADERMARLSQKKEFSPKDLKDAKMAIAASILEARLNAPGGEKFKEKMPATKEGYEKALKQIVNSKAFKQVMPDSKITPETCKKLANNPNASGELMWKFNDRLIQNKKQKEALQKPSKEAAKQKEATQKKLDANKGPVK